MAERAAWGFKNETWCLSSASGQRIALQIFGDPEAAARCVSVMGRLQHVGDVPTPSVLAAELRGSRPWLASSWLEGVNGYELAGRDLSSPRWPSMAEAMGTVLRHLHRAPVDIVATSTWWARPDELSHAGLEWLAELRPYLGESDFRRAHTVIADASAILGSFEPVVSHGDYGPQNALFIGDEMCGLLDFEDARLAHPLLDVAWWNWLVRAHTPDAFLRSWHGFLESAGVVQDAHFEPIIRTLTVLRILETADHFRRTKPEERASWATRLLTELNRP